MTEEILTGEVLPALQEQTKGLEQTTAHMLQVQFNGFFEEVRDWETKARSIVVTDVSQKDEMKQAREARIALKNIRTSAENKRKLLKEDSVRMGKAIDGCANILKALIVPLEQHLEEQETFVQRREAQRLADLKQARSEAVASRKGNPALYNLVEMSDRDFETLLSMLDKQEAERQEAERKLEAERVAKAKADAEERERLKHENARLKAEAEAAARAKAELEAAAAAERRAEAAAAAKAKAKAEAKLKAAEAAAAAERKAREDAERKVAEEKAKAEARAERERKAAERAAKKAARAPDEQKVTTWVANAFKALPDKPFITNEELNSLLTNTVGRITELLLVLKREAQRED